MRSEVKEPTRLEMLVAWRMVRVALAAVIFEDVEAKSLLQQAYSDAGLPVAVLENVISGRGSGGAGQGSGRPNPKKPAPAPRGRPTGPGTEQPGRVPHSPVKKPGDNPKPPKLTPYGLVSAGAL